jgi:hypothetical protein
MIKEETAHPRRDLGKNIADVDFPIVVGFDGTSVIAYTSDELDDILDTAGNDPYSLNSLADLEPEDVPAGANIEQYSEGKTMKISKRQLKRIIKEEKAALIRESVADMTSFSDAVENSASNLSNMFADDMETLFLEDPGMFQGRSTKDEWSDQVSLATDQLNKLLNEEIRKAIESIETNLHDGQYHQPRSRNRPR